MKFLVRHSFEYLFILIISISNATYPADNGKTNITIGSQNSNNIVYDKIHFMGLHHLSTIIFMFTNVSTIVKMRVISKNMAWIRDFDPDIKNGTH